MRLAFCNATIAKHVVNAAHADFHVLKPRRYCRPAYNFRLVNARRRASARIQTEGCQRDKQQQRRAYEGLHTAERHRVKENLDCTLRRASIFIFAASARFIADVTLERSRATRNPPCSRGELFARRFSRRRRGLRNANRTGYFPVRKQKLDEHFIGRARRRVDDQTARASHKISRSYERVHTRREQQSTQSEGFRELQDGRRHLATQFWRLSRLKASRRHILVSSRRTTEQMIVGRWLA